MLLAKRGERPKSELLFERFCQERGVKFERIPVVLNVKGGWTPDWEAFPSGKRIVVEIAQLDPNKNDCRYSGDRSAGIIGAGGTIGQRIRQKITDKADQLKARSAGVVPAMLVVYNNTEVRSYTSPEHVRAAMFGFDTYHIAVPADPSKPGLLLDRKFGKRARMTAECNTSLSALAVLEEGSAGDLTLRVYHNFYATPKIKINGAVLRLADVEQYALEQAIPGQFRKWVRIEHGLAG
ncbi:MAG: hypothetical protein A2Y72_05655 [Chloroflexi bacterium RBG_13_53_26]|nr:MAG: hypothetical protein A2Y72_05655 [Chloroflexi bacterium RBG_13_53_26]